MIYATGKGAVPLKLLFEAFYKELTPGRVMALAETHRWEIPGK